MVDVDVDAFLRQGYWPTSRARSPDSRVLTSSATSSQSSFVNVTPRKLLRNVSRVRNYPPPPSVEDENDSLAKEHGSPISASPGEEPIHRGDPEQTPILLPVHEYNPERRFVIVPTSNSTDDHSHGPKKLPRRPKSREPQADPEPELTSYEANTGRKYEARAHHEEESEKKRDAQPIHEKRRSKLDHLPTIVTDVKPQLRSPDEVKRPKSAGRPDKGGDDYFSPRVSSRLQEGSMLSPDVIEHASRGRDRAYYQGGSSTYTHHRNRSSHSNIQYEKQSPRDDRKYKDKPIKSTSPNHHKRRSTADSPPQQSRGSSKVDYEKPRQYAEPRSPRADRNGYSRSEIISNSTEKRKSPIHNEYYYSSDEEVPHEVPSHRRQESVVSDTKPFLQPAAELRASDKRRSRGPSPTSSPRTSQVLEKDSRRDSPSSSPRSSTFPKEIRFTRGDQQRSKPPLSRTSTAKSLLNTSASVAIPAIVAAATTASLNSGPTPTDPRKSTTFPPPPPRTPPRTVPVPLGPRSSASSLSTSPHRQPRQPVVETSPLRDIVSTTQPTTPYRRYLDDVQSGELPDIHRCPRRNPIAGYVDWLTLPRCDNFNICPSCYEATFSNTEFAHHFVPAPFRAIDRPLACNFGTSRYYHMAYFLTGKYGKADLGLFRNIATVAAKNQPCTGPREVTRIWFSVLDPRTGRPIDSFNVCYTCAKTVELLLPNLTGLFVHMDSPAEPARGVCAMHQDNERRFLFYFDLLEAASDKALLTKSTPDIQALADRIRDSTEVSECARENPVRNAKWYVMRSIPHFTVCEECFGEVVWPMIQCDNSSLAATFHKNPQKMPLAACQLYSERMRSIFKAAVRHNDPNFLESKVRERRVKEQEYHARIVGLDVKILGAAWVEDEVTRARREWQRWE